ncbi:iron dicitrate transporter FecR [Echinicola pacifica]|uniref:Iron dicitrate transporter FecR n=1 Tax=Echinicola pacifica TaxID=346377 RepID=A0A918PJU8_9BACT|nr:FecR family protein [Echinicola pacifica]GGZ13324.1 iron dicitrate transporter FecR [Echinicola pacifica]
MRYIKYSVEDFVQDEYFQKWIIAPDAMTLKFWESWLLEHPEKADEVAEARRIIQALNFDSDEIEGAEIDEMWKNIIEGRREGKGPKPFQFSSFLKVAAVLITVLVAGLTIYLSGSFTKGLVEEQVASRVTLELEDGRLQSLDGQAPTIIESNNKAVSITRSSKTLHYNAVQENVTELKYNKLTVPYGEQFDLVLSDGTKVKLNAGSWIKFPISFLSDLPRTVYLQGEAYFEVAPDKERLFTVVTDQMDTQVFGTKFIVTSYPNELFTSTVLVEGSVGVKDKSAAAEPRLIVPGQRALSAEGAINVEEVNVNKYIAWTTDELVFINDPFENILKRLERHFDISIENKFIENSQKGYSGTFKEESLTQILDVFKGHTPFNYSIENDGIIIYPEQ